MVRFIVKIAESLDIGPNKAQVALVVYGSQATLVFDLREYV